MDSPARKRLQMPFKDLAIGKKFQMTNAVMKAAIPGSAIFTKIDERRGDNGNGPYFIRPDWEVEVL